ncbi:MAG: hypothetical protein R6W48_12520 [Gaiellaceae bacterium]
MKPAVLVATLVTALALGAAGCGGSDEPEASATVEWADGFCTALTSWTDSLKQIGEQFTDLSNLNQGSLEDAVNDAREATDTLVDDLKDLGTPDTESGQEAKQAVDDLVSTLEGGVSEIEETAEGVSGIAELPSAISSLTTTLTAMSQALSSAVSTIESADVDGELESAFRQAPACDALTSSS